MRDLVEGALEDGGSKKSLAGSRRESSKRGRVGDQELAVVLEWQRKHDGVPYSEGVSLEGDGGARSAKGGLEGDKTPGDLQGGGSSRAEPRGLGGPWRRSFPSPERVAPGYNWSTYL